MTARIPVLKETKRMTGMGISLEAITPGQRSWTALLALQQRKMGNSSYFNSWECHLLICFCLSSGFEYADSANKRDFGNNGKAGVIFLSFPASPSWCWHLLEQLLLGTEHVLLSLWDFFLLFFSAVPGKLPPHKCPLVHSKLMAQKTIPTFIFGCFRELFLWPATQWWLLKLFYWIHYFYYFCTEAEMRKQQFENVNCLA